MLNKPFTITVRKEHFTNAVRECSARCVIAQALIEHLGEAFCDHVAVSGLIRIGSLHFTHDGIDIMAAFDGGKLDPDAFPDTKITLTPIKP